MVKDRKNFLAGKSVKSNEDVLRRVGEERSFIETLEKRRKNWIGHVLRGDGLLREVLEGRMERKRPRGRPRVKMLDGLMGSESYRMLKLKAVDRNNWRSWMPRTCSEDSP